MRAWSVGANGPFPFMTLLMTLPPHTSSSREDDVRLERRNTLTLGPLEFLVVGFEGNHSTGQILPELHAAREKGIIQLVDLLFVTKEESGNMQIMALSDLRDEEATPYAFMTEDLLGLLTMEAIEQTANDILNNRTAAIELIEPVWAIGESVASEAPPSPTPTPVQSYGIGLRVSRYAE